MIPTILVLAVIIAVNTSILSIDVLAFSGILLIISYKYQRKTRFDIALYLIAMLLAIVTLFVDIEVLRSGIIAFAMINVVLFTGILADKWSITKKLKSYRGIYSILGFILSLPHVYLNLFVDQEINVFGIASIVIMLPLFITSFNIVKKEMKLEEWIKLQKAAYPVYILLFIHLISIADWVGKIIYAVMMTLYINNKLIKEFRK